MVEEVYSMVEELYSMVEVVQYDMFKNPGARCLDKHLIC